MRFPGSRMFRRVFSRILRLKAYKLAGLGLCVLFVYILVLRATWSPWAITGDIRDQESVGFRPPIRFISLVVEDKPHSITRIIHQTWKSAAVPLMFKSWIKSWIDMNPEYEYWFWTDEDMRSLIEESYPQFLPLYDSYPSQIYRVDAFRYFVLYEHGGIYADIDTSCLRPLDYQMAYYDCLLTQEPLEHAYLLPEWLVDSPLVSNAIIACRSRHPFMEQLIRRLPLTSGSWGSWNDVLQATGPGVMRQVWEKWDLESQEIGEEVHLAEPELYQPTVDDIALQRMRSTCDSRPMVDKVKSHFTKTQNRLCNRILHPTFRNEPRPESFTDHHWAGTWDPSRELTQTNKTFSVLSLKLN